VINISVVIPYYQRDRGILRKALASVYQQVLPCGCNIEILVVDDCSPSPAELELSGPWPPNVRVHVIARSNGGPAAARNTGLDATHSAHYIAFLDSDDQWLPDHLDRAIRTLGNDADFYFSDQMLGPLGSDSSHFQKICWEHGSEPFRDSALPFSIVARDPANPIISPIAPDGSFTFRQQEGLTAFLRSFLPHISTTVIRAGTLGCVRFRTDLRNAGEDYLYFLELASTARTVRFSRHIGVIRGKGVSIYHGASSWDDPRSVDVTLDNYRCLLIAKRILTLTLPQQSIINRRISFRRLELVARLASQFNKGTGNSLKAVWAVMRAHPVIVLLFPFLCIDLLIRRLRGRHIVDRLRANELP
jgi:succinoglycan biosynthesis protein ExoW